MIITHKIKIDMCRRSVPENIDAVQGDGNTRAIQITLTADSVAWEIPAGTTAAVAFLKPDGTKGLYDKLPNGDAAISMSGNTVTAIMAPQVLTCVGTVMASIVFYDRDMDTLATFPFRITAARNPAAGEQISNDYYEFTTLEEVNEAVKAAIASLEKAKEDFMAETGKAQADFLAKAEEALSVVHGAATEDAPAIVCEATGQTVHVTDASNRVLHGLTLYGKTTKNGTESPVPLESVGDSGHIELNVTGANLIPHPSNLEMAGVTAVVADDGTITYSGTTTGGFQHTLVDTVLPAGTYYMSWNRNGFSGGGLLVYNYTTKQFLLNNTDGTFASNGTDNIMVYVNNGAGVEIKGSLRPMMNAGEIALPYEPYKEPQTLTAQTPNGLPGIPVSVGGNYTDENGQQWVSSYRAYGMGKYVQRIYTKVFDGTEDLYSYKDVTNGVRFFPNPNVAHTEGPRRCNCSHFASFSGSWGSQPNGTVQVFNPNYVVFRHDEYPTPDTFKAWLAQQYANGTPVTVQYIIAEPIETPIPAEEMAQYAALHTNKPNTTVYNDAGAGMKLEYVADTKLYVDQKLAAISAALLNA